ncbi:MAG: hypothetical protein ABIY47_16020, partial [Opitutaceae bacterium]
MVGGLMLAFLMDEPFDGQAVFAEPVFEPASCEVQRGALLGQSLTEFRDECTGDGKFGPGHVG